MATDAAAATTADVVAIKSIFILSVGTDAVACCLVHAKYRAPIKINADILFGPFHFSVVTILVGFEFWFCIFVNGCFENQHRNAAQNQKLKAE